MRRGPLLGFLGAAPAAVDGRVEPFLAGQRGDQDLLGALLVLQAADHAEPGGDVRTPDRLVLRQPGLTLALLGFLAGAAHAAHPAHHRREERDATVVLPVSWRPPRRAGQRGAGQPTRPVEPTGVGPETAGVGPETAGVGPETASVGPETASVGPETAGVSPGSAGVGPGDAGERGPGRDLQRRYVQPGRRTGLVDGPAALRPWEAAIQTLRYRLVGEVRPLRQRLVGEARPLRQRLVRGVRPLRQWRGDEGRHIREPRVPHVRGVAGGWGVGEVREAAGPWGVGEVREAAGR